MRLAIFIFTSLIVFLSCHNNAHLRTQRILQPGETTISGSGVLAMGGMEDNYDYFQNTGVLGFRSELSMLRGGKDSEAGSYIGFGFGPDSPGLIFGYDYKKYVYQKSDIPWKIGAQIEVNFSDAGKTLHIRPSLSSTTKKGKYLYGGIHGILAVGNLKQYEYLSWYSSETFERHFLYEEIDYFLNSIGTGFTAGAEIPLFKTTSIQFQVDLSILKNSFQTNFDIPVEEWNNVTDASWQNWQDKTVPRDLSRIDKLIPMVTGSLGMNLFKPKSKKKNPFKPLPSPSYDHNQKQPLFDPRTGEKVSGSDIYDPKTGEVLPKE